MVCKYLCQSLQLYEKSHLQRSTIRVLSLRVTVTFSRCRHASDIRHSPGVASVEATCVGQQTEGGREIRKKEETERMRVIYTQSVCRMNMTPFYRATLR